jgi:predicted nucleotidyltransferase
MSGSAVQRGELAIVDKYTRAEAAVYCGADIVVELPAPFSCTSGEYFAKAGVIAADALSADYLSFGSECGDLAMLSQHAEKRRIAPASVGAAMAELSGTYFSSNDMLAIEYLRALYAIGSDMIPITHKRQGGAYNSESTEELFPSATAIRSAIYEGRTKEALECLPDGSRDVIVRGLSDLRPQKISDEAYSAILLNTLRMTDEAVLSGCAFMNGGLASRMKKASYLATSAEELYALSATKVYTNSRIRRAALCTVCMIPDSVRKASVEYISLLAANERGREYLSAGKTKLPVLTTVREKKAFELFEYEKRLDILFDSVKCGGNGKKIYTSPPVML